jgi:hypothetical protein
MQHQCSKLMRNEIRLRAQVKDLKPFMAEAEAPANGL